MNQLPSPTFVVLDALGRQIKEPAEQLDAITRNLAMVARTMIVDYRCTESEKKALFDAIDALKRMNMWRSALTATQG